MHPSEERMQNTVFYINKIFRGGQRDEIQPQVASRINQYLEALTKHAKANQQTGKFEIDANAANEARSVASRFLSDDAASEFDLTVLNDLDSSPEVTQEEYQDSAEEKYQEIYEMAPDEPPEDGGGGTGGNKALIDAAKAFVVEQIEEIRTAGKMSH